jgi:putative oxidoreductase
MENRVACLAPWLLGLLRVVVGLQFLEHGTQKYFSFPVAANGTVHLMSLFGVQGLLELVGGFLILIGLFTRPVAFLLAGNMAVAYFMMHWPKSFFPALNGGDAAILFCFVFLYMAAAGGGACSIDGLRDTGASKAA